MSSLRRSVYGVPPRAERANKMRFFRKVWNERFDVRRRALAILLREIERKEARRKVTE
jgi:hypothetical protein